MYQIVDLIEIQYILIEIQQIINIFGMLFKVVPDLFGNINSDVNI